MSDFKRLAVWRKSHALALNVNRTVLGMRGTRYASLRSQMMRAAMSVPANIVEGNGQHTGLEFSRFVRFAINSTSELEYHLIAARDIKAIKLPDFESLLDQCTEVRKMLHGLLRYLTARNEKGRAGLSCGSHLTSKILASDISDPVQ